MKKFIYLTIILTIAGAVLSGVLLMQHYYPDANMGFLSCGTGIDNPCLTVGLSDAGNFFGIPTAAFGLLFYLFFLFVLLIADYAGAEYYELALYILLPLTAVSLVIDVILGILMIKMGEFCTHCFYTYLVNIALFILLIFIYRFIRREGETNSPLKERLRALLSIGETESHKKAAFSSFILFSILLVFAVFSTNTVMTMKSGKNNIPRSQVQRFISDFYKKKPINMQIPDSPYLLGEKKAPLTLYVFTDYLCSACYGFYKVEKYLLSRFKGKIRVMYYHYPLDSLCNRDVTRTVYKNSCIASRAMHAALDQGIFSPYIVQHFSRYKELRKDYSEEWATEILADIRKENSYLTTTSNQFKKIMYEPETTEMINRQIDTSVALKINATPTIVFQGRKIVGVPPAELMIPLIENELRKQ